MTTPPTLESRLARVEQVIAALSREVAAIRTELAQRTGGSTADRAAADAAHVSSSETARVTPRSGRRSTRRALSAPKRPAREIGSMDFERLVGRYGMLGIAVIRGRRGRRHIPELGDQPRISPPRSGSPRAARPGVRRWDRRRGACDFGARSARSARVSRTRAGHRSRLCLCRGSVVPAGSHLARVRRLSRGRRGDSRSSRAARTMSRCGASRLAARRSRPS